jgi:hypothetical protein
MHLNRSVASRELQPDKGSNFAMRESGSTDGANESNDRQHKARSDKLTSGLLLLVQFRIEPVALCLHDTTKKGAVRQSQIDEEQQNRFCMDFMTTTLLNSQFGVND